MEEIGHPVVGDKKYGSTVSPLKRLGLHATTLALIHPTTGEMTIRYSDGTSANAGNAKGDKGEKGDNADAKDLTSTQPGILEVTNGTKAVLVDSSIKIVPSTKEGQVLTTVLDTDNTTKIVQWKDPKANNMMEVKVINNNYTVEDIDYTIVASGLSGDITITLPDAASNKGRILVINQNDVETDGGDEITVKFNVPVKYSDKVSKAELLAPFYSATGGTLKISLQSDGTNWYVVSSL